MLATFEPPTQTSGPFEGVDDHIHLSIPEIKKRIDEWLYDAMNGVVQSGPFRGMKLPYDRAWQNDSLGTQILGCYEQELHQYIEEEIVRLECCKKPKIVDIGCASGYYAVGLTCRLPNASTWVIDSDKRAISIAIEAADSNGRWLVYDKSASETLLDADFIICDCEGAEIGYLDPTEYPSLLQSSIIVETHDFENMNVTVTQMIADRFVESHCIAQVMTGSRNPTSFEFLRCWHQTVQWLAIDEARPASMGWLVMRPRNRMNEYAT